ncbi:hypothetical protein [uncultured Sphingomonas sp.]|uniref:hypothetical protein n=1 Tax=uncultured Sphingomonas sp. TaxID=158754 RepID=UPI00260B0C3E|nr:hypothetical protein [uncultured Sphingomonas sp.]
MDDKIAREGLTFRAGEKGFVFYDESRFTGERGRTWAFGTVQEAAEWLVSQFTPVTDASVDEARDHFAKHPPDPKVGGKRGVVDAGESIVLTSEMTDHLLRLLDAQAGTLDARVEIDMSVLRELREMLVRDQRSRSTRA